MKILIRSLSIVICVEVLAAAVLCGWRLNATLPNPPPVEIYTDKITAAELLALPDGFLFDGPEKWRVLGQSYLTKGFLHTAAACLLRAEESAPASPDIAVIRGHCLDRLGQLDDAQKAFERATRQGQGMNKATAWYFLGRIHLQREQPKEADEAFRNAGDAHLPSVYQRAKMFVRSGLIQKAAPLLEQLVEEIPGEVRVWQLKAQWAAAMGRPEEADEAFDRMEHAHPLLPINTLPSGLFETGTELGMACAFDQALRSIRSGDEAVGLRRMSELTRNETHWRNSNPWLLQTVAAWHLEAGELAAARSFLECQIKDEEFPTARAWELLGGIEFLENHPENAWRCWQHAQSMNPAAIDHEKMSLVAKRIGDGKADRHERGLAKYYAGVGAFRVATLDQARSDLRQAVSIDPELSGAWFYLGETERLLGNRRRAETAYRRCSELNPEHGRARVRLERLARRARREDGSEQERPSENSTAK